MQSLADSVSPFGSSLISDSLNSLTLRSTGRQRSKLEANIVTTQICLVGDVLNIPQVHEAAKDYNLKIIVSQTGQDVEGGNLLETVYVLEDFQGPTFEYLNKRDCRIIGYPAFLECAKNQYPLPELSRPLYCTAMADVVTCFTGFRNKEDVYRLLTYIHHMGGSVRKDCDYHRITHLIASKAGGEKYQYAVTFSIPVMNPQWVFETWQRRKEPNVQASSPELMKFMVKIFEGIRVCWVGVSQEEMLQMNEILDSNGGCSTTLDDPSCTHVVIDPLNVKDAPEKVPPKAHVVEVKWFWVSVQMDFCASEKPYLFKKVEEFMSPRSSVLLQSTPGSRNRKRKRLKDTVSQLAAETDTSLIITAGTSSSGGAHSKRRSSISEAALLSLSGSLLDDTLSPEKKLEELDLVSPAVADLKSMTPRQKVFAELLQTETNYVQILETIIEVYKKPLEDPSQTGGELLDPTELKIIFGYLPPIYEVHSVMLQQLVKAAANWNENFSVGGIILSCSQELVKAYPPFINFFEQTKETLSQCDRNKPRFHAFLKIGQANPKCGRQSLQELLIRPVQRLPSISLLLNDMLKHTSKTNPDHAELEKALSTIKEVMTHINEDKRRTEGQVALFDIFNDIENCPAQLVSSHRSFLTRCDVIELGDSIVGRGGSLSLFLFSDLLEICKRRSKGMNTLRRDVSTASLQPPRPGMDKSGKPAFKHVELISLSHVKRVVDIKETDDCRGVFALICRSHQEIKERLYSFAIASDDVDKVQFLRTLCRQAANVACRAEAENYLTSMEAHQLDIDTSDISTGTLGRAVRLASKTRMAVNRAFSFNKTPSKLKRAVSSVMSPLRSSNHAHTLAAADVASALSPHSTGALSVAMAASCTNLTELDNGGTLKTTPSSAKLKSNTFGFGAVRRF